MFYHLCAAESRYAAGAISRRTTRDALYVDISSRVMHASVFVQTLAYLSPLGAVQHHRGAQDAVVIFVQIAVVWRLEVLENKDRLELCVFSISELFDVVGLYTRGVYVLMEHRGEIKDE